jgi:hypothetical protein
MLIKFSSFNKILNRLDIDAMYHLDTYEEAYICAMSIGSINCQEIFFDWNGVQHRVEPYSKEEAYQLCTDVELPNGFQGPRKWVWTENLCFSEPSYFDDRFDWK